MCRHRMQSTLYLLLFVCLVAVHARKGFGPGEQDWGFVEVRPGAHMFYWLYYTTAENIGNYTDRPLIIWLQGGPGCSLAYGYLLEFGVVDVDNNTRNTTWVRHANVLFVDSPVGTGYSYVDNKDLLVKNNAEIAQDLVTFLKKFYEKHAEFVAVPLHIFGESYGGKMVPEFALALHNANERGELKCNLMSASLVSPWTSPLDSMYAWPTTLLQLGLIDKRDYYLIRAEVDRTKELIKQQEWVSATAQWGVVELVVMCLTKGIDVYNIMKYDEVNIFVNCTVENDRLIGEYPGVTTSVEMKMQNIMRNDVAQALNITHSENYQIDSNDVFEKLEADFMRSAVHIVRKLLDDTSVTVNIITGQLDLICATSGTEKWIRRMKWHEKSKFLNASRTAIVIDDKVEGYAKRAGRLNMYWVNRAGHMVPADNPIAMNYILRELMGVDLI